ncbi:MAG: SRPBCC domain-containing protein [Bacteriovoracaceae bacterium]|nr:SRPBCC domain-containing protein [Bacteriovoracaceae bacterium]
MAKAKPNELRLVRVYDAPAKLVWATYTEDKHLTKWWGPRGFTITTKSKDLRPGGKWIYTMHGPDGIDYPNMTTYHVVEPYKKLVYDHGGNEERPKLFTVTVTFEEHLGKTVMDMTMTLDTPEAAIEISKHIKNASGNSTWDRLGEYLEGEQTKKDVFIINRTFKADQKTLFEMWTNPEHLSNWMGPAGASMKYLNVAIKEGAFAHYQLTTAEGEFHFGKMEYKKIQPYELLVYVQSFSDEKGNLVKPGFAPTWPDQMLTTIHFTDEGSNETRITLKWEVYGNANEVERKTFNEAKAGMTGGWTGSFDKLEEALR